MKPIGQPKKRTDKTIVKCCYCKRPLERYNSYLKKYPLSFCSEQCKVYYKDPKQALIMAHINNPNFYYLIGLLATDGHIAYPNATKSSKTYYAMIRLIKNDGDDILNKFKDIFGGMVYNENCNGFYKHVSTCWRVSNPDFVKYLISIGFTHNKTYTLNLNNWFSTLSDEYKKSFIRGCWDGDGTLNLVNRKTGNTKNCSNNICSASKPFIDLITNYFNPVGNLFEKIKEKNVKATCSLWIFHLNSKNALYLAKIYDISNNDLVMKRKLEKWLEIKNYYHNIHKNRICSSKYYGVCLNAIKKWCCIIKNNHINYNFGHFSTELECAIGYDIATIFFNKKYHKINFQEKINIYQNLLEKYQINDVNILKEKLPILIKSTDI